jgi:hypothetical protein
MINTKIERFLKIEQPAMNSGLWVNAAIIFHAKMNVGGMYKFYHKKEGFLG